MKYVLLNACFRYYLYFEQVFQKYFQIQKYILNLKNIFQNEKKNVLE